MNQKETARQRDKIVRSLGSAAEIIRGSLLQRTIRHKQGCSKCARGEGHPVWVLTITYPGGRNKQISLTAEQKAVVERWLVNYHDLKDKLESICELNQALLRPE
jgi:hypothetical protein